MSDRRWRYWEEALYDASAERHGAGRTRNALVGGSREGHRRVVRAGAGAGTPSSGRRGWSTGYRTTLVRPVAVVPERR
ncbi:hypothetical protein ACFQ6S_34690 [Streptomyces sp. NPDC056479]|uniref:hypothetical protein n=1 Tax=Streptomyces sp. NPDC056479 TaxID=3345832 RepID=UPI0036C464E0